jgi:integrase
MGWSEIDRQNRLWTMPAERMKGKRPHRVPLSESALAILDEAEEIIGGSEFVFQSPRAETAMDRHAFSRAFARLAKQLKMPRATPHDFRRTGATNITGERIGMPRFIVAQVLAHADHSVTSIHYDLNDYLVEKRRALDAWAALLIEIVEGGERPTNVVPIATRGSQKRTGANA